MKMARMNWDKQALERIQQEYKEFENDVNWIKDYKGITSSIDRGVELLTKYVKMYKVGFITKNEYNSYRKAIEKVFFNI
jgi:hypothetical protein